MSKHLKQRIVLLWMRKRETVKADLASEMVQRRIPNGRGLFVFAAFWPLVTIYPDRVLQ
jgi:hypothetical protein